MKTTDFQEATAQRILHMFKDMGHRRILLADEVGLGKTMVASRVIELVKKWHEEQNDDFFKVVYICSNINIADQNIAKLGVDNKMNVSESRLSMQHLFITLANKGICEKAKMNSTMPESIIPLTPSTSFRLTSSLGTANERALMFDILKHDNRLNDNTAKLSQFFRCGVKNWDDLVSIYDDKIALCSEGNNIASAQDYLAYMQTRLSKEVSDEDCERLQACTDNTNCTWNEKSEMINLFRRTFARISIDMLNPDLVIMDEFQRFSDLLREDDENEQSMLVHKFFDQTRTNTKVLLLSATPYKPYSTLEEINEDGKDEHYEDFVKVMDFLFTDKKDAADFQTKWQRYSVALKRTDIQDLTPLVEAKDDAQESLYGHMCRTERFNSGILDDSHVADVDVLPDDIVSYAQGQSLLERLKLGNLPIEYVKSSPYLLSFMDRYVLKQRVEKELDKNNIITEVPNETLLLSKYKVNNYYDIAPSNGKLKYLHDLVFGEKHNNGEKHDNKVQYLLWVPASHPYYKAGGVFESEEAKRFSKIILFSSWEMVPRMVSCMMSYYAELYTLGEIKKKQPEIRYAVPDKKNRYGENRLRADNLLEYPCKTLAGLYVPKDYYGQKLSDIRRQVATKIKSIFTTSEELSVLPTQQRSNSRHILAIMKMMDGCFEAEEKATIYIPANAIEVLSDIAIASPAVCAYRQSHNCDDAKMAAKAIVSIFNKSESAAIIDLLYNKKGDDDYYESVLKYCVKGNLQSVLDEYAHMLNSDKIGKPLDEAILGTSVLKVDTKESIGNDDKKLAMRTHFAIPFVDKTLTDKTVARTTNIRNAFNSPFRPFILSSTSIGQEGLDFHWYARKIVHWNLPSNPVDLEQREGRINRYKCLAVRQNVARLYGDNIYEWDEMFKKAKEELKGSDSDMVPYWCLPFDKISDEQQKNLEKIERIVPLYPLSRDRYRYERLIKVLSLYRMTLGQPRQEELLELLKDMKLSVDQLKELIVDLCPFNKNKHYE